MSSRGDSANIRLMETSKITAHLRDAFPSLIAVYGFGSHFAGQASSTSDIDLAILIEGKVTAEALWEQRSRLEALTGSPVDLVDLRAASTVMQYQIISTGQRLWQRDSQADIYESFILSEKTSLDAARAALLQDIGKTGRVCGP